MRAQQIRCFFAVGKKASVFAWWFKKCFILFWNVLKFWLLDNFYNIHAQYTLGERENLILNYVPTQLLYRAAGNCIISRDLGTIVPSSVVHIYSWSIKPFFLLHHDFNFSQKNQTTFNSFYKRIITYLLSADATIF